MYGISPSFVTRANVSNNCEYMQDKGIIVTHGCWPLELTDKEVQEGSEILHDDLHCKEKSLETL